MKACRVRDMSSDEKHLIAASSLSDLLQKAKDLFRYQEMQLFTEDGYLVSSDDAFILECQTPKPVFLVQSSEHENGEHDGELPIMEQSESEEHKPNMDASDSEEMNLFSPMVKLQLPPIEVQPRPSGLSVTSSELYPIREIFLSTAPLPRDKIEALMERLETGTSLLESDRRLVTKIVGLWLYSKNGTEFRPPPEDFHKAAVSLVECFPILRDPSQKNGWEHWYDIETRTGRLSRYVRDKRHSTGVGRIYKQRYAKRKSE